jgi:hypothetical protein
VISSDFEDLRPYSDAEINSAMIRITNDPLFKYIADFLYPEMETEFVKQKFRKISSINDFQMNEMVPITRKIINNTITHLSFDGSNHLKPDTSYLYVSNHRDIVMDSALSQLVIVDQGHQSAEISFGSNLMMNDFIIDIGKSNKMYKVMRGGNPREFYNNSKHLSAYIRHTIQTKKESIWIAQRNGRTKDGNDETDQGLLRMFSMSGSKNIPENLAELNIVPISISYQYEPCISMKVNEIYISRRNTYKKRNMEDLESILHGLTHPKGKTHIHFSKPLTTEKLSSLTCTAYSKTMIQQVTNIIDQEIHNGYHLFDTNYIAYDILNASNSYLNSEYTLEDKSNFEKYMLDAISSISGDADEIKNIFLGIYANPVINKLKKVLSSTPIATTS